MSFLDRIEKNKNKPPRMFIYGGEKIGKTTFVSQCPGVIFLPTESGLDAILDDVPPALETYEEVRDAIGDLLEMDHTYQAVAIDSLTGLERLIHAHILREERAKTITAACGGYGAGYIKAAEMLRDILAGLDALRNRKGMGIFLIGHAVAKAFNSPDGPGFDRWIPRGHEAFINLAIEWVDVLGFAAFRERIVDQNGRSVAKGFVGETGNQRVLRLDGGPSCRAGSRYKLPAEVPLDWSEFQNAFSKRKG